MPEGTVEQLLAALTVEVEAFAVREIARDASSPLRAMPALAAGATSADRSAAYSAHTPRAYQQLRLKEDEHVRHP